MSTYRCVICGRDVTYEGRWPEIYPFCSSRCRMVDLGLWFREAYAIDCDLAPGEQIESSPSATPSAPPQRPSPPSA